MTSTSRGGGRTDATRGLAPRAMVTATGLAVTLLAPGPAAASFLSGEALDTAAIVLAWVVMVARAGHRHRPLLDGARAAGEDRAQAPPPAAQAIKTLCLLSLVFGGLLWPIAWLWAYTRPVGYRLAYGTDKHEDYFARWREQRARGRARRRGTRPPARRARRDGARAARCRRDLATLRDDARQARPTRREPQRSPPRRAGSRVMELILLGIYAAIVWFIFIKMKWLPWNMVTQVIVVIIPIVALTALILALNVVAPSTADVRVIKYVINIVPQVRGRVHRGAGRAEPAGEEGRRAVPDRPHALPAARSTRSKRSSPTRSRLEGARRAAAGAASGKVAEARSAIEQAEARVREVSGAGSSSRGLRVEQNRELVATGAGDKFDLEQAEADLAGARRRSSTARAASAAQARVGRGAGHGRRAAGPAAASAPRSTASTRRSPRSARSSRTRKWELSQTTVYGAGRRLRDQRAAASRLVHGRVPRSRP